MPMSLVFEFLPLQATYMSSEHLFEVCHHMRSAARLSCHMLMRICLPIRTLDGMVTGSNMHWQDKQTCTTSLAYIDHTATTQQVAFTMLGCFGLPESSALHCMPPAELWSWQCTMLLIQCHT